MVARAWFVFPFGWMRSGGAAERARRARFWADLGGDWQLRRHSGPMNPRILGPSWRSGLIAPPSRLVQSRQGLGEAWRSRPAPTHHPNSARLTWKVERALKRGKGNLLRTNWLTVENARELKGTHAGRDFLHGVLFPAQKCCFRSFLFVKIAKERLRVPACLCCL